MKWRLVTDDGVTASFGLAADETIAQRVGTGQSVPTLRLYTYRSHCALVGRFQNVENEVRLQYCRANNISINRRPTGGGAILMGDHQLGVALTIPGRGDAALRGTAQGDAYSHARELMGTFSEGLVGGLKQLGVQASFRRKNDIEVNGKKMVGLGIYRAPSGGLLFHASLLVDLDIALMLSVLNTPFEKLSDKEIATIAERITTVRRETNSQIGLDDVRAEIGRGFAACLDVELVRGPFTADELQSISALEKDKYLADEWVYQTSAVADTFGSSKVKTSAGLIDVRVTMAGSTIKAAFIGGDFFAAENAVADLEASLRWHTSQPERVAGTIEEIFQSRSSEFSGIEPAVLVEAVQKAVARARVAESQMRADPYGCYVNPGGVRMPDLIQIAQPITAFSTECLAIRREHFGDEITFHAPGLRGYKTDEYAGQNTTEFVSISVTGTACALSCEHCKTNVLHGMTDLRRFNGSLFDLCSSLAERGARGVLISGGSDKQGRVPLLAHIPDLIRVRNELGLAIRVHPGLPDEETCAALGEVGIDGAMIDIIGHRDTIRAVYHLDSDPEDYENALAWLEHYKVPTVPHIILGLHFGKMLGEPRALEMIVRHPPKVMVMVVLMPLSGTPMVGVTPPSLEEIGTFFEKARRVLLSTPVMLGCARPMGNLKVEIDRLAVNAGLNGIAYPANGIVEYARQAGLRPRFINACCGVTW